MTIGEARKKGIEVLTDAAIAPNKRSPSPALDTDVFLSALTGLNRASLLAHPELGLGDREELFCTWLALRTQGLPVAYITGSKEFWGLPFTVTPDVLIPKPDTEILVQRALELLKYPSYAFSPCILDVCTGSGCIAISIAHSIASAQVCGTDISPNALAVARMNSSNLLCKSGKREIVLLEGNLRLGLPRLSDVFQAESGREWDMIVSNPPYVPTGLALELLEDGRKEPLLALDGGADGLDLIRDLISNAFPRLHTGGYMLIETGEYNAQDAAEYVRSAGFIDIVIHTDLEGQDRVVEGKKP